MHALYLSAVEFIDNNLALFILLSAIFLIWIMGIQKIADAICAFLTRAEQGLDKLKEALGKLSKTILDVFGAIAGFVLICILVSSGWPGHQEREKPPIAAAASQVTRRDPIIVSPGRMITTQDHHMIVGIKEADEIPVPMADGDDAHITYLRPFQSCSFGTQTFVCLPSDIKERPQRTPLPNLVANR